MFYKVCNGSNITVKMSLASRSLRYVFWGGGRHQRCGDSNSSVLMLLRDVYLRKLYRTKCNPAGYLGLLKSFISCMAAYNFLSAHGAFVLACLSPTPWLPAPPPAAHGAAVPAPGGGMRAVPAPGGALVPATHGARVGWFGPAGTSGPLAFAHGAAVIGIAPAVAIGSRSGR